MSFKVHAIQATLRFVQGYRFLDRCGEALVKLENALIEGWIPTETSPKSGTMKSDVLGMTATFSSEMMAVAQTEFISFDHFLDQTCKIYDTLWQTFEIKRINGPSLKVLVQKGFNEHELAEACRDVLRMQLCKPNEALLRLLGGTLDALDLVVVTEEEIEWNEGRVPRRRRLGSQVIRQEKNLPFDDRLLKRIRQLPENQQHAMAALMRLRSQQPTVSPIAVQIDLENSFETELGADGFDLPTFLKEGWEWAESLRNGIIHLGQGKA